MSRKPCARRPLRGDSPVRFESTDDVLIALEALIAVEPDLDAVVILMAGPAGSRVASVFEGPPDAASYLSLAQVLDRLCRGGSVEAVALGRVAPLPVLELVNSSQERAGFAEVLAAVDAHGVRVIDVVALGSDHAWSLREAARWDE